MTVVPEPAPLKQSPFPGADNGFVAADIELAVVSFDIDGTMCFGDPPGPVSLDVVRAVAARGHLVGSASDRARADQAGLWERHGIDVAFVGGKHHLPDVKGRFSAVRYVHIGDTEIDEHFARLAGFEFVPVLELPSPGDPGWLL
jgi:hypothetical protein